MKDGIPKGNGESRRIMAMLPETYDEFRLQAHAGNLLADIFFHAAGWRQQPDFLNKRNLLQDTTAALYGLDSTAVVNDVFTKIKSIADDLQGQINKMPIFVTGSYLGDGTKNRKIPLPFAPSFVIVSSEVTNTESTSKYSEDSHFFYTGSDGFYVTYASDNPPRVNKSGVVYGYIAFRDSLE